MGNGITKAISKAVLDRVSAGETVEEAFNAVLGAGSFKRLAGELYDALRGGK